MALFRSERRQYLRLGAKLICHTPVTCIKLPVHLLILTNVFPFTVFLRNRLKYALTGRELIPMVMQRLIKIDGKVRTDPIYPSGFMGRFAIHCITPEEATFKLLDFKKVAIGARGVSYVTR
ncbi:hypothetical protein GG344DRAFT_71320 [Lentinula edodes]|nr:hypothetical protein GG344DRAFT_71320 [Lentinula edodes]